MWISVVPRSDGPGTAGPREGRVGEEELTAEEDSADHEHSAEEEHEVDEELLAEGVGLFGDSVGHLAADDVDRLLRGVPAPVATDAVNGLLGRTLDPPLQKSVGALLVET